MADNKQCFMISPIGDPDSEVRAEADWVLQAMVKPALEPEFEVHRADEYAPLYVITNKIITEIRKADLIVADLTGHNPNVFYELCVAHAFSKPVVPLIREGDRIPFDNAAMGTIIYSRATHRKWESAKANLRAAALEAIKPNHVVSNPITMALGTEELKASGDSRDQQMAQIQETVQLLTRTVARLVHDSETTIKWIPGLVPQQGAGLSGGTYSGLLGASANQLFQAEVARRVKAREAGEPIEDGGTLLSKARADQPPLDKSN
jgi:hypothetical protein